MSETQPDWTTGAEALVYQNCRACGAKQYFRRAFCAACGSTDLTEHTASGRGVVHAISVVHRAATAEARAHVPYAILLVDSDEGFRLMAHGDITLTIGERVTILYRRFLDRLVPYAERNLS
jgi:uncharacterized OB-fold protein